MSLPLDTMSSCTVSQGDLEKYNQALTDIQMEPNVAASQRPMNSG